MTGHFRKKSLFFRDTREHPEHDAKNRLSISITGSEKTLAEIESGNIESGNIETTIILKTRSTLLRINSKTFLSNNEITLKRKLRPMEMKASGENDDRIKGAAYMILQDRFCYSGGMQLGCL